VKKIKDAFEKPFRNNSTSTLPSTFEAGSSNEVIGHTNNGKSKGGETATHLPESSTTRDRPWPPREPSPIWDLELDLDLDANVNTHPSPESGSPPVSRPTTKSDGSGNVDLKREGSSSPIWDIELDLNGSDEDDNAGGKGKDGFGAAQLL
jgi:DNA excision repair protein ERCC-1